MDAETERLMAIFRPRAMERAIGIKDKIDFVHYTNAASALNIFRTQRLWMRSVLSMNDYREFNHGLDFLLEYFRNPDSKREFVDALNACSEGLAKDAIDLFDRWTPHNRMNLYVACFSEHNPKEDRIGRLSMWRAYTRQGAAGVALVFDSTPFFSQPQGLHAYGSPVSYLGADAFKDEIGRVVQNIRNECDFLKGLPRQKLIGTIFDMLLFAATCSKHAGFEEELEWRLMHFPKMHTSTVLERTVETISGIPQVVYKLPFKDIPEQGLVGIELPRVLKRVIIGPSNAPWQLYEAFVEELKALNVPDAGTKVFVSDIPLRAI